MPAAPDARHGTALALTRGVAPLGVLIIGPAGAGKSRLALALLSARPAFRLISDDLVMLQPRGAGIWMSAPLNTRPGGFAQVLRGGLGLRTAQGLRLRRAARAPGAFMTGVVALEGGTHSPASVHAIARLLDRWADEKVTPARARQWRSGRAGARLSSWAPPVRQAGRVCRERLARTS